jgi:hypothetical protein
MRISFGSIVFGYGAALWIALYGGPAVKAATPYAITATNVTMPATGNGASDYTVSGIPVTGLLMVSCQYSGPTTTAHIPSCSYVSPILVQVQSGQTVTGAIQFSPVENAPTTSSRATWRNGFGWPVGGVVAASLLLGLRFRIGAMRWLSLLVLTAGLAGLIAIPGCAGGSNSNGMTPGTYAYTLTASNTYDTNPEPNIAAGASTTISVTVP